MKKYFILVAFALAACGGFVKNENGSENLKQLDAAPVGCSFLYKIKSEASVYEQDDARRYLENRIAEQSNPGNAYWVTDVQTKRNEGAVFGPEYAFVFTANVYDCPNLH